MISHLKGMVFSRKDNSLFITTGAICYEVLIPGAILKAYGEEDLKDKEVRFVIYHYYQMQPSRAVPVLIGFNNEVEKEFFENFISVSGVGPKAACKALEEPFSAIASAIDSGDIGTLKGLPGIGAQRARQIIAKLQGKVGKYCLIRDQHAARRPEREDIRREAMEVLAQLQYKKAEAEEMVEKVLKSSPGIKRTEELLDEVYRQKKRQ